MNKLAIFENYNSIQLSTFFTTHYYRDVKQKKYTIKKKLRKLYEIIFTLMSHLHQNYENKIFNKFYL